MTGNPQRSLLRNSGRWGGEYKVVKNTLVTHAIKGQTYGDKVRQGPNGMPGSRSLRGPERCRQVVKALRHGRRKAPGSKAVRGRDDPRRESVEEQLAAERDGRAPRNAARDVPSAAPAAVASEAQGRNSSTCSSAKERKGGG